MSKTEMIYLASKSKARAKILKDLGIKFKVIAVSAREKRSCRDSSYPKLVKDNSLLKAKKAAKKIKSGIIIAADTICVQDGKIFGKPKNLRDAAKMLKKLSSKPQWLYSGVAVIGKGIGRGKEKTMLDYEKTKIYMDKLSGQEIKDYFSAVSPLDKAGSFDIQGKGAYFIRRVEGCYYNVVGLPVRKLYRMFKKLKVDILLFLLVTLCPCVFVLLLSGCSTEYNVVTGEQESYFYSTDKEVQMGQSIARQIAKEYKPADDPLMQVKAEEIGKKIVAVCDRKDIDYTFIVLQEDDVNAVSLPGGYVYVFSGLMEKLDNDDELAGVIAHEVGHIVARHSIKKLQAAQAYQLFRVLIAAAPQSGNAGAAADAAFLELLTGYSREDEMLADQLGVRYAKLAGYNPKGMIQFMRKLDTINKRAPLRERSYYRTHPSAPDRIRVIKQEMGENIDFNDYINIDDTPHGYQ